MTVDGSPAPASPPTVARRLEAWAHRPRTALLAGAVGAVLGLAIAGFGLFTAKGTAFRGVPPEDAAVVNGRPILKSDLVAQALTTFNKPWAATTPSERRQVLDDMLREELFVQRGLELDEPGTDPDSRAALVAAVQAQVAVDATSEVPSEAQLQTFYDAHRDHYASIGVMTVRDLVPARAPAAALPLVQAVDELRSGKPLAEVMARYGLKDSGKVDGEELYFAAKLHLGDRLFDAARNLDAGGVVGPIAEADGSHILDMQANARPRPRSFGDARSQVYSDYKQDLEARLRDGETHYLRGKADIQLAKDLR